MICRIWHGWTTPENADAYDSLLREEIFHNISARKLHGYLGIDLLRRELGGTHEFITVMWFDHRSAHHEVRERRHA